MAFNNITIPWPGWKIVAKIGEGGFGTVYKIESVKSGVTDYAALKVIRIPKNITEHRQIVKDTGSKEKAKAYYIRQKDDFLREIEILKQFKGTGNIVYIENWDVRELDDGYSWEIFIQMELLTPLDKKIADEGLPSEEEIIKIGKDICTALKRCESKNIVHRDIKPENILVNEFGDYKLSDFGIARNLESITTITGIGARPYMAPEVASYKKAGKSIDTYSLGIVLYELLNNNRLPFIDAEGDFTRIEKGSAIQRRLDGERIPAPAHGSEDLKRIVLKACEYKPKDRYKNASAMLKDLEQITKITETTSSGEDDFRNYLYKSKEDSSKPTDAVSLKALENDKGNDSETSKKIDKFYTFYRKNEEFQKLLDEEYCRLKGENIRKPTDALSFEDFDKDTFGSEEKDESATELQDIPDEILNKEIDEKYKRVRGKQTPKQGKHKKLENDDGFKSKGKKAHDYNKDPANKIGNILLMLIVAGFLLFTFRDEVSTIIPTTHKEDAIFDEHIQGLYDDADTYVQGYPAYHTQNNEETTVLLKYAIADFDGDKTRELLVYWTSQEGDTESYDNVILPDIPYSGCLTFNEIKENAVDDTHHSDFVAAGWYLDDVEFINSGVALYKGKPAWAHANIRDVYDVSGDNFQSDIGGYAYRYTEDGNGDLKKYTISSTETISSEEISEEEADKEWQDYEKSGRPVKVEFSDFKDLSAKKTEAVDESIPELANIMGAWVAPDGSNAYKFAMIADVDGKLKVTRGAVPGGGLYATFAAKDISIDNHSITATGGFGRNAVGKASDYEFTAIPSDIVDGEYVFTLRESDSYSEPVVTYSKIGNTERELQEWLGEHLEN